MRSTRFGMEHFHHPDLLAGLQEFSPEDKLRDLIDETIFGAGKPVRPWSGKAEKLRTELRKYSHRQREVDEILVHSNSCGTYLGRLKTRYPDRVRGAIIEGHTRWTIEPRASWIGFPPAPNASTIARIKTGLSGSVIEADFAAQEAAAISRASLTPRPPALPSGQGGCY